MSDPFLDRARRRELARLLSQSARGQRVGVAAPARPGRVVAVTGPGGVGKSTLVGKLIEQVRGQDRTIAVLACDPESPLSGGAILGDRFRMPARADDDGVYIRSLAAAAGHGPLAEHLPAMVRILESFGFDWIVIETAGAGQGDTAVRDLADVVVLLLQPEIGDDLQWEKAGLLEVADVVAIHKADLPGADDAVAQVKSSLELPGAKPTPVLRVSSKTGEGIAELTQAIEAVPLRRAAGPGSLKPLLWLAQEELAARFARLGNDPRLAELAEQHRQGQLDDVELVDKVLRLLETAPH
jgi:LAO/AO transport system kinase